MLPIFRYYNKGAIDLRSLKKALNSAFFVSAIWLQELSFS